MTCRQEGELRVATIAVRGLTERFGDPSVLILDEPANGLDPQAIRLRQALDRHGVRADERDGAVLGRHATADTVSELAAGAGPTIHEISAITRTLEDVCLEHMGGQEVR
jgi:hypothetical protein